MQMHNSVNNHFSINKINQFQQQLQKTNQNQSNFSEILKNAIHNVNDLQVQSDVATEKLARGENIELHNVMIAAQKASISLQLSMEVRNKVIESYQEIMRMQV